MTVNTQNHIRDSISVIMGVLAGSAGWADFIQPLAMVSPKVAHSFPLILAAIPIMRGGLGIIFRLYNTWYPETPSAPATKPALPPIALPLIICALLLPGCATTPPATTQAKLAAIYQAVYPVAVQTATAALSGEKGQTVAAAALKAAESPASLSALNTVLNTNVSPAVANAALSALSSTGLNTGPSKVAALQTVAAVIQQVANEQFAAKP